MHPRRSPRYDPHAPLAGKTCSRLEGQWWSVSWALWLSWRISQAACYGRATYVGGNLTPVLEGSFLCLPGAEGLAFLDFRPMPPKCLIRRGFFRPLEHRVDKVVEAALITAAGRRLTISRPYPVESEVAEQFPLGHVPGPAPDGSTLAGTAHPSKDARL